MRTEVLTPSPATFERLAAHLRAGGLVGIPTETVYGLAGIISRDEALRSIFDVKGRPLIDPLIVHLAEVAWLARVAWINEVARRLAEKFWPGPLTLVLPKVPGVSGLVTAGMDTVAVRVPAHPVARELLRRVGEPLAAPSANPFGAISPTRAAHVVEGLGGKVPFVLDGGPSEAGVESTIVGVVDPEAPRILRPGAIPKEAIEEALGGAVADAPPPSRGAGLPAPGMLERHYSPRTPLRLFSRPEVPPAGATTVWFQRPEHPRRQYEYWLTEGGGLAEAAFHLYDLLHRLDAGQHREIWVERPPGVGLGVALNDRLRRAAAR